MAEKYYGKYRGTVLQNIRNTMPDAANELGAYQLRQMATPPPGQAGERNQDTRIVALSSG